MADQDNFFRGASLGMNAVQAGIQAQQNRTNLAERARQFDISHKLAVKEHGLREEKFTLELENAELDQQFRQEQIREARTINADKKRILDDRTTHAPSVAEQRKRMRLWNKRGLAPEVDPTLPKEIYEMLRAERTASMSEAADNTHVQATYEGDAYMKMFHYQKMIKDEWGNPIYNHDQYLALKGQDEKNKDRIENYLKLMSKSSGKSAATFLEKVSPILDASTHEGEVDLHQFVFRMRAGGFSQKVINESLFDLDPNGAMQYLLKNMPQDQSNVLASAPTSEDVEARKKEIKAGVTPDRIEAGDSWKRLANEHD